MKTRKRFCAHQSIHREITLHTSRGVQAQLFRSDWLAILFCENCDLPSSAAIQMSRPFIEPIAFVAESNGHAHRRHAHRGHRRHKKRHDDLRAGEGCSTRIREFYAEHVASFPRCSRVRAEFDISLRSVGRRSRTRAGWRGNEGTEGRLKLAFGVD